MQYNGKAFKHFKKEDWKFEIKELSSSLPEVYNRNEMIGHTTSVFWSHLNILTCHGTRTNKQTNKSTYTLVSEKLQDFIYLFFGFFFGGGCSDVCFVLNEVICLNAYRSSYMISWFL